MIFTSISPWLLFLGIFLFGFLATRAGKALSVRNIKKGIKSDEKSASQVGALLGLLAFMLAFTFSITSNRFAERKKMVVQQAKVLGTLYLRTSLIPDSQRTETRRLLKEYARLLTDIRKKDGLQEDIAQLENIQLQVWKQAVTLYHTNMDSEFRALYIASVNEVIDIFGERKTVALVFRIPTVIWVALLLLFVLSMFLVGYEMPNRVDYTIPTSIMAAAFALTVTLIADMDATKRVGNFVVNNQPLREVYQMILDDH